MKHAISHSDQVAALTTSPELKLVYETAPIGLAFLTTDCRYVLINQHLTEICGLPIADHIGRRVRDTVPQVAHQVEEIVKTILDTGEPVTGVEVNGQRPDGGNTNRVWITYWHPLKDQSGTILGINVAAEEITERKRAEAALAASKESLRQLNETLAERVELQAQERNRIWNVSQDLLAVSDLEGRIISINPAWSVTLGWSEGEIVGKPGESLVHPDDRERASAERAALLTGRGTQHFENRMLCKDGTFRWLAWRAVPDRGLIYAVGRDVTAIKEAQDELHALHRALARVSREHTMGAMTASITHEINQPLAAIVTSADAAMRWLTRAKPNLAETRTALERIARNGQRISDLVTSVRAMFGGETVVSGMVDVGRLVREILALVHGELDAHRVVLESNVPDTLPTVMGERTQLQQVLLNLIMNAIEAMDLVNDRDRKLAIGASVSASNLVEVVVSDTGRGIEPSHLDRIFDVFFTTKPRGMGVGLAVCRSIIEAHGGKLWVKPRDPFGTEFHLTLQIAQNPG